jgi:glycosyltransferase involved in cell wall biosynthesis
MSKSRHIVIDARRMLDFGIGTYIRNLIRGLSEIDSQSRYTLVVPPGSLLPSLGSNFQTAVFAGPESGILHHVSFSRFLRQFRADLYHIPLNSVAYWMPQPYVVTIHDMSSLLFPSRGELRETLHKERYRRGAARASRIIAVSNSTRRDIETVLRVDPERIRTIYSAPDPAYSMSEDDPDKSQKILDRYSISPPYVLYAGAIRPQKNVPRLVEAFAVLRNELQNKPVFQDLKLVILGDELSRSQAVRRAVIAARLESHVRFLGFVPAETLRVFYRAASVFAFPSLYEGFGLAPLEAMSCGTPVVSSDLPALIEAVGDAAELVSPDNVFDIARGLRIVLEEETRREELQASGRTQAARFNWTITARSVLDIYREIAQ